MPALKGAFANLGAGLLGALPNFVVFQFNPETISRTPSVLSPPPPANDGSGRTDGTQRPDVPGETMSFSLRIDATDQLVLEGNPVAATRGIHPTLSALELLMVPKSSLSIDLFQLSGGKAPSQLPPGKVPIVLFFWGTFRILPIMITSLTITETEFDILLNPVRAEVSVSLQVLTPSQITDSPFARGAYKYTQGVKEVMAALNLVNAAEIGVSNSLSFLL